MRNLPISREAAADMVRAAHPDVGPFKVLDILEARRGYEVLLHHATGTIQWVFTS